MNVEGAEKARSITIEDAKRDKPAEMGLSRSTINRIWKRERTEKESFRGVAGVEQGGWIISWQARGGRRVR